MEWLKQMYKKNKEFRWLLLGVTIFLVVVIVFWGLVGWYQINYRYKMYLGIRVGDMFLAGKTRQQTKALVQAKIDRFANQGIDFYYKKNVLPIEPIVSSGSETGLAHELWLYDTDKIVDDLYSQGRQDGWLGNTLEQLRLMLFGSDGRVEYVLKEEELKDKLEEYFGQWETPGREPKLVWKDGELEITEEQTGLIFDYTQAVDLLRYNLSEIDNQNIQMELRVDSPEVGKAEANFLLPEAEEILKLTPLTLRFELPGYYQGRKKFNQTEWQVDEIQLMEWLKIKRDNQGNIVWGIEDNQATEYLKKIAEVIDTPAKDAKFEVKDGRVTEWQSSQDGFLLNIAQTIRQLEIKLIGQRENKIDLVLSTSKSKIANENVNNLGIRELVGVGESNFSGSPVNRRHNIAVGAETLNGLLIKPNEEFSLLEALGEVDATAGYKPELVIKEGKTVPEYGGGLCQIGTTMFRLAINTGLPITQRRNHSYRVSYYEPAGTDATIYNPWPDFKFINDTPDYLLLQTRIEGDSLIFEFWGTSDGRQVATTTPAIYNIVAPGEPEYIETTELEPGEKRRIEYAHNGADTDFKRTISWPKETGREEIEEVWTSHYVPWKEKWLVGVEELSTSTDEVINN